MKRNQNFDYNRSQKCFPAATTWTPTEWKPDSRMDHSFHRLHRH